MAATKSSVIIPGCGDRQMQDIGVGSCLAKGATSLPVQPKTLYSGRHRDKKSEVIVYKNEHQ